VRCIATPASFQILARLNRMKLVFKIFGVTTLCGAALVYAGVSGLLFQIWPTSLHDQALNVSPEVTQRLRLLQAEQKFCADPANFYPGAIDEAHRAAAQALVDQTIARLIVELPKEPRRATVLRTLKTALGAVNNGDSEDRDQTLHYFQKILNICGMENSGELFNVWRYGFPLGWFA